MIIVTVRGVCHLLELDTKWTDGQCSAVSEGEKPADVSGRASCVAWAEGRRRRGPLSADQPLLRLSHHGTRTVSCHQYTLTFHQDHFSVLKRISFQTQTTNNTMDAFKGKYERTNAENYDEFLKVGQSHLLKCSNV